MRLAGREHRRDACVAFWFVHASDRSSSASVTSKTIPPARLSGRPFGRTVVYYALPLFATNAGSATVKCRQRRAASAFRASNHRSTSWARFGIGRFGSLRR